MHHQHFKRQIIKISNSLKNSLDRNFLYKITSLQQRAQEKVTLIDLIYLVSAFTRYCYTFKMMKKKTSPQKIFLSQIKNQFSFFLTVSGEQLVKGRYGEFPCPKIVFCLVNL